MSEGVVGWGVFVSLCLGDVDGLEQDEARWKDKSGDFFVLGGFLFFSFYYGVEWGGLYSMSYCHMKWSLLLYGYSLH